MDHAAPERLGELVRALLSEHPDVEVLTDVRAAEEAPVGSVLVLMPKPEDADWLNMQRPVFSRRELKVVLFCDRAATLALAERAVDFFDWVSQHHDCPQGPPLHAVFGFRRAVEAEAPGVVWVGAKAEDIQVMWSALAAAFPGEKLSWVSPQQDYAEMVETIRSKWNEWVACHIRAETHTMRFRWALAEVGRRTRAIAVMERAECPGWWPVHARLVSLEEARGQCAALGMVGPGRLAALSGLEPEALELVRLLAEKGIGEGELVERMAQAEDAGAALAKRAYALGIVDMDAVVWRKAPPPLLRGLDGEVAVRERRVQQLKEVGVALAAGKTVPAGEVGCWAAMGDKGAKAKYRPPKYKRALRYWGETNLPPGADAQQWVNARYAALGSGDRDMAGFYMLRSIERSEDDFTELANNLDHFINQYTKGDFRSSSNGLAILRAAALSGYTKDQEQFRKLRRYTAFFDNEYQPAATTTTQSLDTAVYLEAHAAGVHRAAFSALIVELAHLLVRRGAASAAETLLHKTLGTAPDNTAFPSVSPSKSEQTNECIHLFLAQPGAPEPLPPETRVRALRILAEALLAQGRYEEAEDIAQQAFDQSKKAPLIARPEQWRSLSLLGRARILQNRYSEGKANLQSALQQAEETFGKNHLEAARLLLDLARAEAHQADTEAADTARRAITAWVRCESESSERDEAIEELGSIAEG